MGKLILESTLTKLRADLIAQLVTNKAKELVEKENGAMRMFENYHKSFNSADLPLVLKRTISGTVERDFSQDLLLLYKILVKDRSTLGFLISIMSSFIEQIGQKIIKREIENP